MLDFNDAPDTPERAPALKRDEVVQDLLARLPDVLAVLLPGGKRQRTKFWVGDVLGSPGESLDVVLNGAKAGLWTDRATGQGGDILDLIAAHHGLDTQRDFHQVLQHAADLTGTPPQPVARRAHSHRVAAKLAASSTVGGVERLARSDRRHASTSDEWDADPFALNTPGGVVNLHTGQLKPHDRADRMTKIATATPWGECPTWREFLGDVTGGDSDLQIYLQRMVGYCLTGSTDAHALFFLYGTGANGKSVFINVIATILGDYAANAPMDTFMEARGDRHPTDLAGLRGARLVSSIETEQGRRWNESKVKAITGGDTISARFMRQDFFEYRPQFKLVIAGNHKPSIRNVDEAMKRRLHLIPFTVTIPPARRDPHLTTKLLAERDGILRWAIEGCLQWQQQGLKPPAIVQAATEEYFEAEDALGQWLDERCLLDDQRCEGISDLFADWRDWAERAGEYVGSVKRFSELMTNRQFEKCRLTGGARGIVGIALRPKPYSAFSYHDD